MVVESGRWYLPSSVRVGSGKGLCHLPEIFLYFLRQTGEFRCILDSREHILHQL